MTEVQGGHGYSPHTEKVLNGILGRIRDTDTHEMSPAHLWEQLFGPQMKPLADFIQRLGMPENAPNSVSVTQPDDQPITEKNLHNYWSAGCLAPGAYDMQRRLTFMDVAGIQDCFVFGTSLPALATQLGVVDPDEYRQRAPIAVPVDPVAMGRFAIRAYADWCSRVNGQSPRLRAVPMILTGSLDGAVSQAEDLIRRGARAILLPSCTIGGKSPAHPDVDALWTLLAKNNVAALLHVGSDFGLLRETGWADAPVFSGPPIGNFEHPLNPYSMAISHLGSENYVTNLVLGAVFERVPDLRFGVVEQGAYWFGSTAEAMDMWAEQFPRRYKGVLTMPPSGYVARNIRVSPFHFEPVDTYFQRYPSLRDCYCFSSDYPHYEGGKSPVDDMAQKVAPLGDEMLEKFFVTNAEWIMPTAA